MNKKEKNEFPIKKLKENSFLQKKLSKKKLF